MSKIKEYFQGLVKKDVIPQEPANYDAATLKIYIDHLEAENAALRGKLKKAVLFALGECAEDECAGDDSVGIPPCPMWHNWDTDGNGTNIERGCYLKEYLAELKGE